MLWCVTSPLHRRPAPAPKPRCNKFGFGKVPGGGYQPERSRGESLCFFYFSHLFPRAFRFSNREIERQLATIGDLCRILSVQSHHSENIEYLPDTAAVILA